MGQRLEIGQGRRIGPHIVAAGFSPMEALQAATTLPAEFPGKKADLGTVEVGKIADLVLLDADPMESISHTRKIRAGILGGRYLDVVKMREAMAQARHRRGAWRDPVRHLEPARSRGRRSVLDSPPGIRIFRDGRP